MEKRLSVLAIASVTLFIWTFHQPFIQSSTFMYVRALAAVGVQATVEPNGWNTLAAQIDAKQKELDAREAALSTREQALQAESSAGFLSPEWYTTILALILLILVLLNFYLDWRRGEPNVAA